MRNKSRPIAFGFALIAAVLLGSLGQSLPKSVPHISTDRLRSHVTTLASEEFEGRLTGTVGEHLATTYVVEYFKTLGLTPLDPEGSYFHEFEFTSGMALGENNTFARQNRPQAYTINTEWRPIAFSNTGDSGEADVVFAGYGIVAPPQGEGPDDQPGYDSYGEMDVHGKWVVMLRYAPENVAEVRRHYLNQFSSLRQKALQARERGALGIIVASGPTSGVTQQLVPLQLDATLSGSQIFALSITDALAQTWLGSHRLEDLQTALDSEASTTGFALPDVRIQTTVDITRIKKTGKSVLAKLVTGEVSSPGVVFLGAHVDHLGRGDSSASRASEAETGQIHFGADDNASGVAGLLELAAYFSDRKREGETLGSHDLIFAAWSGEELGLLGSNHFLKQWTEPKIIAYLNMDMIGRLRETLVVQGTGSSSVWTPMVTSLSEELNLPLTLQTDPYVPTDAMSFYLKHIPVLSLFTGSHEEYHTPRDTVDRINFEGLTRTTQFASRVIDALQNPSLEVDYLEVSSPIRSGRGGFRVYLGTLPDYSAEDVVGVRLSGTKPNSPASAAGLREGDIIVELSGKQISNLYDYTDVIRGLRPGKAVDMKVHRGSEVLLLTITPISRD